MDVPLQPLPKAAEEAHQTPRSRTWPLGSAQRPAMTHYQLVPEGMRGRGLRWLPPMGGGGGYHEIEDYSEREMEGQVLMEIVTEVSTSRPIGELR